MSKKNSGYRETRLVKSKRKHNAKGFFTTLVIVLSITFVILCSSLLSGALTVGNFSFLFNKTTKSVLNAHSYYFVTLGEYDDLSQAQNVASGAILMGAGGYIWSKDNKFYVVGSVYKNLEEANIVVEKNTDNNYNMKVLEIVFNKVDLNDKNYTNEQIDSVINSVKFFDELFAKCYDFSIKLDKKELSTTFISSELNELKSQAKIWASKLDAINSVAVSEKTIHIKNSYISLINTLDNGVLKVINGVTASSDMKYLNSDIISIKYKLFQNIY